MLERIVIENYRCYNKHEIEFKNLSIVVGKNNAGKSTLIEAIRLISLAISRFRSVLYHSAPRWLELPARAKGINPSLKSFGFNTENLFYNYGSPPAQISAYFSKSICVKVYLGQDAEIFCVLLDINGDYITSKKAANQIDIPQINILPQITRLQKEETSLNRDYIRQNLSTDLASSHFRNQLVLLYENYPKFVELSEQSWDGLRIRSFDGQNNSPGSDNKLLLLIQDGGFVSEVGWMGSGLQMWLQIMWFLSRSSESEVVVLDEPDVYMHPDLQRKLIRLLRNKYKQVIVSTHSIEIISEVEATDILIIDKEKPKSLFATEIPVVQRILNSIGSIHNLQLTKLWTSKKLIIVEGEDIDVLKRIQNKIFPDSNESFDSIPNFDIGGWGGWNYARGSSMLLKRTIDNEVKIYSIFDSDYYTEEEIEERKNEGKKINVNIHIWSKKELENYLIVPTAILRIIKEESKEEVYLNISDIEKIIVERLKDMEDVLVDNLADAIQKKDRKLSIGKARKTAKSKIDKLENRICGKDLISSISKWSQEKFKVSLSPIKIASNLLIIEIDNELKNVIQKIERSENFEY